MRRYTDEALWAVVRQVAATLRRPPTRQEFYALTGIYPDSLTRRFGRWKGIWALVLNEEAVADSFPERARDAIERVRRINGGITPGVFRYDAHRRPTDPSAKAIQRHFGSWAKALAELGFPKAPPGPRPREAPVGPWLPV